MAKQLGGMLFADDFAGVSDSKESQQMLIDVVNMYNYSYCSKMKILIRATYVRKSAMKFSKNAVNDC